MAVACQGLRSSLSTLDSAGQSDWSYVRKSVTRLLFVPFQGYGNNTAEVTLCHGLLFYTCVSQAYFASAQLGTKDTEGLLQGSLAITLTRLSLAS